MIMTFIFEKNQKVLLLMAKLEWTIFYLEETTGLLKLKTVMSWTYRGSLILKFGYYVSH